MEFIKSESALNCDGIVLLGTVSLPAQFSIMISP